MQCQRVIQHRKINILPTYRKVWQPYCKEVTQKFVSSNSFRKNQDNTNSNHCGGGGTTQGTYSPNASRAGRPHIFPSVPSAMVSASTSCRPVRWKAAGSNSHDSGERQSVLPVPHASTWHQNQPKETNTPLPHYLQLQNTNLVCYQCDITVCLGRVPLQKKRAVACQTPRGTSGLFVFQSQEA